MDLGSIVDDILGGIDLFTDFQGPNIFDLFENQQPSPTPPTAPTNTPTRPQQPTGGTGMSDCAPKYVFDPTANCGQGKWIRKSRKRRRRLATNSDIADLAKLKAVLGQGKAFETWIATHGG